MPAYGHSIAGLPLQFELDACPTEEHTSMMLDWAAQLRDETGRSWGECIRTAQIMYYG
jgi:hypothetical protein